MGAETVDLMGDQRTPVFPFPRPELAPPVEYAELRDSEPFKKARLWNGSEIWLITRFNDVRTVLADNRFSINPTRPGFPNWNKGRAELLAEEEPTFLRMDPPDHTVLRRMLAKEFTQSRIEALRPQVQQAVDSLIGQMTTDRNSADFYAEFALPLPSIVISQMLGVPYEDHDLFQECGRRKLASDDDSAAALAAGEEMRAYLDELLARKEADPGAHDDLMSRLVVEQIRPGNLDRAEAIRMAELLLVAGHETTANMLALGTLSLLLDRQQFENLKANPDLATRASEEMLRYHSIVQYGGVRVAIEDVEVSGQLIRAGEGVIALLPAANWDSAIHPDPATFDITKKRTMHVAFGFGIHQCLGQPLARLEMDVVCRSLPQMLPNLRLDVPPEQIDYKHASLIHGVASLPVRW